MFDPNKCTKIKVTLDNETHDLHIIGMSRSVTMTQNMLSPRSPTEVTLEAVDGEGRRLSFTYLE